MLRRYSGRARHILGECLAYLKDYSYYFKILIILLSFTIPFILLYYLDPHSFSVTWKGRTFYLFFLWLVILELIFTRAGERPTPKNPRLKSVRTAALCVALPLPTIYVVAVNFLGLETTVTNLGDWLGIPFAPVQVEDWIYWNWGLSLEYLVFATLFAALVLLGCGKDGLKDFSISLFFVSAVGTIYMIDTLYPYGYFTPLQAFVPFTASLASRVLNWMGYQTAFLGQSLNTPILAVYDTSGHLITAYGVGWPCAGVQSLLIYTFVMLIFFKKTLIPPLHRIAYFLIGALVTYIINVFRIVTIYLIYINNLSQGREAAQRAMQLFHAYYGGLYSMAWIISYPLVIIGSRVLWAKIKPRLARAN